jgi:ribosomal protein S18 acetylase RimI-like enzyme
VPAAWGAAQPLYLAHMAVTIRTGNAADMQKVFPLLYRRLEERAAVDPAFFALRKDAPARFRHWLGPALEDPRHALVVAEEGGAIVGCLAATVEQDLPIYVHDEYAVIRVLWVEPQYRGKGIAGGMLEHAARECGQFGLRQLRASAAVSREIEKHILKKAGFRAAGITFLRELEASEPAETDE